MRRRLEMAGWMVFLVGSFLFAANSLRVEDYFGAGASLTFSVGCLLFITAFFKEDMR